MSVEKKICPHSVIDCAFFVPFFDSRLPSACGLCIENIYEPFTLFVRLDDTCCPLDHPENLIWGKIDFSPPNVRLGK